MKLFRKQDKEEKDIGHLNLASRYGLVKPGYRQDLSSRVLEFAYLPDDERVVLLGSMDGSYPYWISETDIGDIETNTAVVESILRKDFSSFTGMTGELSRKLKDCYRRRILVSGQDVKTPFGHGYAKEQPEYRSGFIAGDICFYYKRLKNLCKKDLMDLIRLEDYLLLSDNRDIRDSYIRIRNVISELYNAYMSIVR